MKIKGSTGKVSRTLKLHMVMAGVQAALGGMQMFQSVMDPLVYSGVVMGLTVFHSMAGMYLRAQTNTPLHSGERFL